MFPPTDAPRSRPRPPTLGMAAEPVFSSNLGDLQLSAWQFWLCRCNLKQRVMLSVDHRSPLCRHLQSEADLLLPSSPLCSMLMVQQVQRYLLLDEEEPKLSSRQTPITDEHREKMIYVPVHLMNAGFADTSVEMNSIDFPFSGVFLSARVIT